jgi:hypothetical protein
MNQAVSKAACLKLLSCLAYFSDLIMEATYPSGNSFGFQWTALRYIPDGRGSMFNLCTFRSAIYGLILVRNISDRVTPLTCMPVLMCLGTDNRYLCTAWPMVLVCTYKRKQCKMHTEGLQTEYNPCVFIFYYCGM